MQELTEIFSPTAHKCATPRIERLQLYEPVSGRWSWLTVFQCCNQAYDDAEARDGAPPLGEAKIRKAA